MHDEIFIGKMKEHIQHVKSSFDPIFENNAHSLWEFLKYEIRKFTITYSKNKAQMRCEKILYLEKKLNKLEKNLENEETKIQYNTFQEELNEIYEDVSKGIKIRSRCNWYELGEKSNKYFLNLEKYRASQNVLHKICVESQEITNLQNVNSAICEFFYKSL